MNSLERIAAAVRFEDSDPVPVIAQVFAHAATLAGVPVDEYVRDGETLARCQLEALSHYCYDAVFSVMDVSVEAEALGSTLQYRRDRYPVVERYALSEGVEMDTLSLPDPYRAGRMPEMLKALGILREEIVNEALIVGCVVGPFTLTTQLLGLEKALYMAADDFPQLERVMDFATEVIISFGEAQLRAGAHLPIVFDPSASPDVIPPNFFREIELPRLLRVFRRFTQAGAFANWLHIAGPARRILPYYPQVGVDIANFDYGVSPADAAEQLPATCVNGNIKSITFVEGSPEEIASQATDLLRFFRDRRGFILSSGCEIPPESAPENVSALVHAAHAAW